MGYDDNRENRYKAPASELESESAELGKVISQLQEREGGISAAWKGESADLYICKLRDTIEELSNIQKALNTTAEAVREQI